MNPQYSIVCLDLCEKMATTSKKNVKQLRWIYDVYMDDTQDMDDFINIK